MTTTRPSYTAGCSRSWGTHSSPAARTWQISSAHGRGRPWGPERPAAIRSARSPRPALRRFRGWFPSAARGSGSPHMSRATAGGCGRGIARVSRHAPAPPKSGSPYRPAKRGFRLRAGRAARRRAAVPLGSTPGTAIHRRIDRRLIFDGDRCLSTLGRQLELRAREGAGASSRARARRMRWSSRLGVRGRRGDQSAIQGPMN